MKSVDVLVSGRGSNAKALHTANVANIRKVIADCQCPAIEWAQEQGFETIVVPYKDFDSRDDFCLALARELGRDGWAECIVCAGFMRILTDPFFQEIETPIVNIHPSLLPSFKGINAQKQAFDAGVVLTGASVHFVTPELDGGPIIVQKAVVNQPGSDAETLANDILAVEHELLPATVKWVLNGTVAIENGSVVWSGNWQSEWQKLQLL